MTIQIVRGNESLPELALGMGVGSTRGIDPRRVTRVERRRSDRVQPGRGLLSVLRPLGPSNVVSLSLGGVTLDCPGRIDAGVRYRLVLKYGDLVADTELVTYRTKIQELFYAANGRSWVRYRSYAVFHRPSVAALNLIYRVIGDHWVAPDDDDTLPCRTGSA